MFDRRLLLTGVAVVIVSALAVVAATLPAGTDAEIAPIQEIKADVVQSESSAEPEESEPPYEYLIKEHDGRIAVFRYGEEEPEMVFDKSVRHLPEYDRGQLEHGVEIADAEELAARIEDYIS